MSNKVSVIMPIYKVEKYLEKSINSVLNQTYTNFELILVDDGSPDNCPSICDNYAQKDSRIKVVHKQNGGLSSARNAGLDIATGKYVYFIDSDDYIEQTLLEFSVDYMDKGYELLCFGSNRVNVNGEIETVAKNSFCGEIQINDTHERLGNIVDFTNYKFPPEVWNKFFVMDVIQKYNLRFKNTKIILSEDTCFTACYLSVISKIFITDKIFYNYLQREDSLWAQSKNQIRLDKINNLLKEYYFFLKKNQLKSLLRYFSFLYYEIYFFHTGIHLDVLEVEKIRELIKSNVVDFKFMKKCFKKAYKSRFAFYLYYAKKGVGHFNYMTENNISKINYIIHGNMFLYKIQIKLFPILHKNLTKKIKLILQKD